MAAVGRFAGAAGSSSPERTQERSSFVARDAPAEALDEALSRVERCIQEYHGAQLSGWTADQRGVIRRAADRDRDALNVQKGVSEGCLDGLAADLQDHRQAREEMLLQVEDTMDACEQDFRAELQALGERQSEQTAELIAGCGAKISENGDAWLEGQWDTFDGELRTLLWQHARLLGGQGLAEGVAELYQSGELQPHLDVEQAGWTESQERDLQLLLGEIEKEHKEAFDAQSARLQQFAPAAIFGRRRSAQLAELAGEDRQRLAELEAEVCSAYDAEISACLVQAEEDYRGYDLELQAILFRTMRRRISDAAHMRQLKLALCRWRLDYQRVYHDHCDMLSRPDGLLAGRHARLPASAPEEETARQLGQVRQLVVDLWARNRMPNAEIRRFLDKIEAAAVSAGRAEPLAQVYQEELSQYGALPILEHADRPELLECWLQTLRDGELPPGATRRPSIGSSF